jgi:outer membrane murein-binding lipoprotein Lpp
VGTPPGRYTGGEPPPGGPPYAGEADPASVPATKADLLTLRRWLIVAAIWAVAASAIALIALLDDDGGGGGGSSNSLSRVESRLNDRIDKLENDIQEATSGGNDVSDLRQEVDDLQADVDQLKGQADTVRGLQDDINTFNDKLTDFENRITQLEDSQGGDGQPQP